MASKGKPKVNIPPMQLALILVLCMVAVGLAFYFLVYQDNEAQMAKIGTDIAGLNQEIASLEDTRRNLLEVQAKSERLQKRFEILQAKIPENQEELNEFLSAISQRAQNARIAKWIRFEQLDPEPHPEAQQVEIVPIEMVFHASYDSATAFFWELSTMGEGVKTGGKEQLVNVKDVTFKRDDALAKGLLLVSCTAETYLYQGLPPDDGGRKSRKRRGGSR